MITSALAAEFTAVDLAKEEGKFAAYTVKNGMRAAFLEFFAAQSWQLRPELADAQAWIRGRPDPPIVLDWRSQLTILSASGDMGFSTGPSIYRSKADPKAPSAHGEFFSVWQRQQNGEWPVLIDHGISHGAVCISASVYRRKELTGKIYVFPNGQQIPIYRDTPQAHVYHSAPYPRDRLVQRLRSLLVQRKPDHHPLVQRRLIHVAGR